jgi:hypothetical protein
MEGVTTFVAVYLLAGFHDAMSLSEGPKNALRKRFDRGEAVTMVMVMVFKLELIIT